MIRSSNKFLDQKCFRANSRPEPAAVVMNYCDDKARLRKPARKAWEAAIENYQAAQMELEFNQQQGETPWSASTEKQIPLPVLNLQEQLSFAESGIECSGVCYCDEYLDEIQFFTISRVKERYVPPISRKRDIEKGFLFLTFTDLGHSWMLTVRHKKKWNLRKVVREILSFH